MLTELHIFALQLQELAFYWIWSFPLAWNANFTAIVLQKSFAKRLPWCLAMGFVVLWAFCCACGSVTYGFISPKPDFLRVNVLLNFIVMAGLLYILVTGFFISTNINDTVYGFNTVLEMERRLLQHFRISIQNNSNSLIGSALATSPRIFLAFTVGIASMPLPGMMGSIFCNYDMSYFILKSKILHGDIVKPPNFI
ncbi:unnamed protein product [Orchesella dallaii]|uniref:Uncharacterized protein n=1 Tax=Orchesella dallaii TaxID=48710 RepID=A0ABP1S132_9HEXA